MHTIDNSEQSRLALLYTLQAAKMRLTEPQLARIMSEASVMNFFDLKTALQTLADGGQIVETPTMAGIVYELGGRGETMIDTLRTTLRRSVREAIDAYMDEHRGQLEAESALPVTYAHVGDGKYRVQAQVLSDDIPIFQLTMILDSRKEANIFVANWKEKGPEIYQRILLELTI